LRSSSWLQFLEQSGIERRDLLPEKPPRMHWRTHGRLFNKGAAAVPDVALKVRLVAEWMIGDHALIRRQRLVERLHQRLLRVQRVEPHRQESSASTFRI
jgi:hypothetical protein